MKELQEKLLEYVDKHLDEIYEFLANVISFDSTNYINCGKELECQKFICGEYKKQGANVEIYTVKDCPQIYEHPDFEEDRKMEIRPNVTVFIPCAEEYKDTAKNIMLSSHSDTMPVGDISQWRTDPFKLSFIDGKAYGLGISDNKCGSAETFAIFKAIKDMNLKLRHNLYLTVVSDEEYFGGNGSLLACLKYPCDIYVNLDGCDFEPQVAGLGGTCFKLDVKCAFDTSTTEPAVDALYYVKTKLQSFAMRRFAELESNPLYTGSEHAKSAFRIMEFGSGSFGTNVDIGALKIVVYSTKSKAELQAELDELFSEKIKPFFEENGIVSNGFERTVRCMEYAETRNTENAKLLAKYMSELADRNIEIRGACLSDLDIYIRDGSPDSFNVGLIREFKLEGGAHKPNEYIKCSEFENLTKALLLFVTDWCRAEEE
ncbi:MAG: M20/M25/M40 family metallo-hydrolase [Oscillospiraceae bacterium]